MSPASDPTTNMHYMEQGSGLPVVLVHGFPLDSRIWDSLIQRMSANYRFIVPDLPGFGKSKSDGAFTMKSAAESLHALLEKLKALPCVLAGLSMGGYIALEFAREYPTDLKGLILIDTKAEADTAAGKEGRDRMIEQARTAGSKAVADAMMPKMLSDETVRHQPQVLRDLRAIMEGTSAETIAHALAAMRDRSDHMCNLPSIADPTLIIVGEQDALIPVATAQSMQKEIPHARLEVIKGAGHLAPMEQPEQVSKAMESFLETIQ